MTQFRHALLCYLSLAACSNDASTAEPAKITVPARADRFEIRVTDKGFEPGDIRVPAGRQVTFIFERKSEHTCVNEVVLQLADASTISARLPLDTPVEITATFPTAGKFVYACSTDIVHGTISVR